MEWGIVVACVSLFGTAVLVIADARLADEPPAEADTVGLHEEPSLKKAA